MNWIDGRRPMDIHVHIERVYDCCCRICLEFGRLLQMRGAGAHTCIRMGDEPEQKPIPFCIYILNSSIIIIIHKYLY